MIIFGDDGFRDKINEGLLSKKFLKRFFNSLNYVLFTKKITTVVIGYDTRKNNSYILRIIKNCLISVHEIKIINYPLSTPALQYLCKKNDFGIMITASHFPHNYNGFKFFLFKKKIQKDFEQLIEKNIDKNKIIKNLKPKIKYITGNKYIADINKNFRKKINSKVLIDCGNGAISSFYSKITFFKNLKIINKNYKKNKINFNCGTNFFENNLKKNFYKKYDFCVSYDGDADRFLVSKKKYGIIETEKLALIFVRYYLKKFSINSIVSTVIVNPWLCEILRKYNVKVYKSKVGDRNVLELKEKKNSIFGFETSGHFCFHDAMDGLYSTGLFLNILNDNPELIDEVLNIDINYEKLIYAIDERYLKYLQNFKVKQNNNYFKILIRKSIWNKFYKAYIFYKPKKITFVKLERKLNNKIFKKILKN